MTLGWSGFNVKRYHWTNSLCPTDHRTSMTLVGLFAGIEYPVLFLSFMNKILEAVSELLQL